MRRVHWPAWPVAGVAHLRAVAFCHEPWRPEPHVGHRDPERAWRETCNVFLRMHNPRLANKEASPWMSAN